MKKINLISIIILVLSLYWFSTPVEIVAIIFIAIIHFIELPIALTATLSGLNYIKKKDFVFKNLIALFVSIIISSVLTVSIGFIIRTVKIEPSMINNFVFDIKQFEFIDNLGLLFPNNIFTALTSGNMIIPLIIFTVLGLSIKFIHDRHKRDQLVFLLDSTFMTMNKMTELVKLLFPLGFISLAIYSFKHIDMAAVKTFSGIILVPTLFLIILFYITLFIVSQKTNNSIKLTFFSIIRSFLISIVSGFRLVAIPFFITDSINGLKLESSKVKVISPFYFTLIKIGDITIYTFLTLFVCKMYDIPLTLTLIIVTYFVSLIASFLSLKAGIFISIPILTFLWRGIGIPVEPIYMFFISIGIILNPIREGINCLFAFIHLSIVDDLSE